MLHEGQRVGVQRHARAAQRERREETPDGGVLERLAAGDQQVARAAGNGLLGDAHPGRVRELVGARRAAAARRTAAVACMRQHQDDGLERDPAGETAAEAPEPAVDRRAPQHAPRDADHTPAKRRPDPSRRG